MGIRIWFCVLSLAASFPVAAQTCTLPDTLWERPRSGQIVLALPELRACVQGFLDQPDAALMIHHGMADEAALRAAELRYWLIALALDGARIDLKNDLQINEPLKIEIRNQK